MEGNCLADGPGESGKPENYKLDIRQSQFFVINQLELLDCFRRELISLFSIENYVCGEAFLRRLV